MGSSRRNLNWIGRTASWLAACLLGGKTGPTLAARQPAAEAPSRVSLGQAVVRLADQSGLRVVACIPAEMETCTVTWSRLEGWRILHNQWLTKRGLCGPPRAMC